MRHHIDFNWLSTKQTATHKYRRWQQRLATILCATLTLAGGQAHAATAIHNIVLVHGAFTDGSVWAAVVDRLHALGYHVTAVQNPLTSLADDVAATQQVLRRQSGAVLLVGHSWAGAVISQAGNAANVKGLVYLSALAPDDGESVSDLLARLQAPMGALVPDSTGMLWLDQPQQFQQTMAADVPMKKVLQLAAVQQPIAAACFTGKIQHAAWHDKPSWYVQTTRDQALRPGIQLRMAGEMGAARWSIPASHLSMVSRPAVIASLIDQAARAAGQ